LNQTECSLNHTECSLNHTECLPPRPSYYAVQSELVSALMAKMNNWKYTAWRRNLFSRKSIKRKVCPSAVWTTPSEPYMNHFSKDNKTGSFRFGLFAQHSCGLFFMKPSWNLRETFVKPSWNLRATFVWPIFHETFMKPSWNLRETFVKPSRNIRVAYFSCRLL
jgi:hypothetical protein